MSQQTKSLSAKRRKLSAHLCKACERVIGSRNTDSVCRKCRRAVARRAYRNVLTAQRRKRSRAYVGRQEQTRP